MFPVRQVEMYSVSSIYPEFQAFGFIGLSKFLLFHYVMGLVAFTVGLPNRQNISEGLAYIRSMGVCTTIRVYAWVTFLKRICTYIFAKE
jgi:hypothetical protein